MTDTDAKQQATAALHASYAGKLCPILTSTGLRKQEPSKIVGATPKKEDEAVGCQGPNCQFFILTGGDEHGNPIAGACAVALIPSALSNLGQRK